MKVVFDAGVVFSGAGWRGEAHLCLVAMARRRIIAFATSETLDELRRVVSQIGFKVPHSPYTILDWYYRTVKIVSPAPLGKQRSRDPRDDPPTQGSGRHWSGSGSRHGEPRTMLRGAIRRSSGTTWPTSIP